MTSRVRRGDRDGQLVGPRCEHRAMKLLALSAAVIAMMVAAGGTAHADPTPPPSPGYQIQGPSGGPQFPGAQVYPPRCRWQPRSCGLEYDPGSGTWNQSG
jgi:hypothetical protein